MIRSLLRVLDENPGFDPADVLSVSLALPDVAYPTGGERAGYYGQLLERIGPLPGVESVAVAFPLPLGSPVVFPFRVEGRPASTARLGAFYRTVSLHYFRTLRIPLRRGRLFADTDREGTAPVVIVNETMAARTWPGEDPIGRRVTVVDRNDGDRETVREVVGIVGDVRHRGLDAPAEPEMYVPFRQAPSLWMASSSEAGTPRASRAPCSRRFEVSIGACLSKGCGRSTRGCTARSPGVGSVRSFSRRSPAWPWRSRSSACGA
jgi:hypothetical protein